MCSLNKLRYFKLLTKNINNYNILSSHQRRHILSPSYLAQDQWNHRLNNPLLASIKPENFFRELMRRYNDKLKVSAVDVDIFANICTEEEQIDELDLLLLQHRKNWRTRDTFDSTHHATCRLFFKFIYLDQLRDVIINKIEYGVFPDFYCFNYLMDKYIEDKQFTNAAKIAVEMMLQEDFGNEISKRLALYATEMYLKGDDPTPWAENKVVDETDAKKEEETKADVNLDSDDEEQINYVRIPFTINPYFDDHFDIKDPLLLCGKTLYLIGKEFDDAFGRSAQLIGLALYQKWSKASEILEIFKQKHNDDIFMKEVISRVNKVVESLSEENEEKPSALKYLESLKKVEGKLSSNDYYSMITEKLNEVPKFENQDSETLGKLFKKFEQNRENALSIQLNEIMKQDKLKEIEKKQQELKEKEELLFFFENFNKHEMEFTEVQKRLSELKSQSKVEEEYIPPRI